MSFYRLASMPYPPPLPWRYRQYLDFCIRRQQYLAGRLPLWSRRAFDHDLYAFHVPEFK